MLDGIEIDEGTSHESLEVTIDARSRFFDGHFPDRPVLPGVAQLLLVEAALRRRFGDRARIASLERLRLVAVVCPGDRLTVRLTPVPGPTEEAPRSLRFEIARGASRVSEGWLRWSESET
jgi:3-hydroxymyristoyl/3-hydroxydecanoyl-(acyl carrier protein) dehydratase